MTVTPETIARHELAGLRVRVVAAPNPDLVGLTGRVIDETTNTLIVRPGASHGPLGDPAATPRQLPKAGTTLAFRLPDGTTVEVDGDRLVARPARRTETGGDSVWV